jgi:acrylyl-CoA reductase (NADPH)
MENETFEALVITQTDQGKFTREIKQRKISDLPEHDTLIKVSHSSLNYKDGLSCSGAKGVTNTYPHTPGIDAAGSIVEDKSGQFQPGDQVIVTGYDLGMNTSGGYGQYIRVPSQWVVPLPKELTAKESMAYGTAGFTAALSVYQLIYNGGFNKENGQVLVTGATGGVGSIAVGIMSKLGHKVTAVSGKPDKNQFLMDIGADQVVTREAASDESGRPMLKSKWDAVIDTVGGNILATAIKELEYGASATCCGMVAGFDFTSSVFPFILRGVNLLGVDSVNCPMDIRKKVWENIATQWKLPFLEKIVTEVGLDELDPQIDLILKGGQVGRIVVQHR